MGFGKDKKGVIFEQEDAITLLTLASETALAQDNIPAMTDSLRIIKSEGMASIEGATLVDGDGPIRLYLASGDLTMTEIAEKIAQGGGAAGGPLARDDITSGEEMLRPVFYLGMIDFRSQTDTAPTPRLEWSKTIRWTFGDTAGFQLVAWNHGSGALTTGGKLRFHHTAFGVWVGA